MIASRRSILAGLAASPIGLAFGTAQATDFVSPDADLIALASHTGVLNTLYDAALDREYAIEDRWDDSHPPRPIAPARTPHAIDVEHGPRGALTVVCVAPAPDPASDAAALAHTAAVEAWEAEKETRARRMGLRAAQRKRARIDRRFREAAGKLIDMSATTPAGLAAKARIAIAVNPNGMFGDEWMARLSASVLRDAVRIGGGA